MNNTKKYALHLLLIGLVVGALAHILFYTWRHPRVENEFTTNLNWMQSYFNLSATQYEQVKVLHSRTGPELQRLFNVLRTTSAEIDRMERQRKEENKVDFIHYHDIAQKNRLARQQSRQLTLGLVYSVAEIMTQEQKDKYFDLVGEGAKLDRTK